MEDTIKRSDVTEAYAELYDTFDDYPRIIKELHKVYDKILAIPSAEKQSEWIPNSPYTGLCSECGGKGNLKNNFCPDCGARMKGADDE